LKQLARQHYKRVHANCISGNLIRIAKVKPALAAIMCDEAKKMGIANQPLAYILKHVGGKSAATYDVIKAAQDSQNKILKAIAITDNNPMPSTEPGNTAQPNKTYPVSQYSDIDDCVNGPNGLVSLGLDSSRALQECQSYFAVGTGTGKGANIKHASRRMNTETKKYYAKVRSKQADVSDYNSMDECVQGMQDDKGYSESDAQDACQGGNFDASRIGPSGLKVRKATGNRTIQTHSASVTPNEVEIPSWVYAATGGNPPNLPNGPSNSNLKGASLDNHIAYMEAIHEPISDVLRNRAEHRVNQSSLRNAAVKDNRPAWAICANL
jgi:hypothetical protein